MKKIKVFCGYLTLFLLMKLIVPVGAWANMLPIDYDYLTPKQKTLISFGLIFVFIIIPFFIYPLFNCLVEGFVARLLLMKKIPIKKGFMKSFFEINIMTFYPAAILLLWIETLTARMGNKTSIFFNLFLVEILVVIAEYFLIKGRLRKLYPELLSNKNLISKRYLFLVSLVVNTCSVVFGLLLVNIFLK